MTHDVAEKLATIFIKCHVGWLVLRQSRNVGHSCASVADSSYGATVLILFFLLVLASNAPPSYQPPDFHAPCQGKRNPPRLRKVLLAAPDAASFTLNAHFPRCY